MAGISLYLFLALLIILPNNNAIADIMKYNKPYFGIHLELTNVGIDLRLNDIPVYFDNKSGQLSVDLPASESIIDGRNALTITAFPPIDKNKIPFDAYPEGADITARLYVQEIDDDSNREILATISLVFDADRGGELVSDQKDAATEKLEIVSNSKQKTVAEAILNIDSPFPRWAWQDGQEIEHSNDNYLSLLDAYRSVHTAFQAKDKNQVFKLYEARAKEAAAAYHLNGISEGHIKVSTGMDMNDPSLELVKFWEKDMELDIFANGKLARIQDPNHGQPIVFLDKEARQVHLYKMSFYKDTSGNWVLIR